MSACRVGKSEMDGRMTHTVHPHPIDSLGYSKAEHKSDILIVCGWRRTAF